MTDAHPVRVPRDYWATRLAPEGLLERWRRRDGDLVDKDSPVAEVSIEGVRCDVLAPASGRLQIQADPNTLVEPDCVIATIQS